jgi:hypothetical protein
LQIAFFSPSKPLNNNKKRAEIDWLLKFWRGRKITPARFSLILFWKLKNPMKKKELTIFVPVDFTVVSVNLWH